MTRSTGFYASLMAMSALSLVAFPASAQGHGNAVSTQQVDVTKQTDCAALCNAQFTCVSWEFEPANWENSGAVCSLKLAEARPQFSFDPANRNQITVADLRSSQRVSRPAPTPARITSPAPAIDAPQPELVAPAPTPQPSAPQRSAPRALRVEPPVLPTPAPGEGSVSIEDPLAQAPVPTGNAAQQTPDGVSIAKEDKVAPWPPEAQAQPAPVSQPQPQQPRQPAPQNNLQSRQLRGLESEPNPRFRETDGAPRYSVQRDAERLYWDTAPKPKSDKDEDKKDD